MRRMLTLWVTTILLATVSWATASHAEIVQTIPASRAITASITATGTLSVPAANYPTVSIQLSGTWVGTVPFGVSNDKNTFAPVNCTPVGSTTTVQSATANGQWVCPTNGAAYFGLPVTAWTSGTATVTLNALGAGGGGGGGGSVPTGTAGSPNGAVVTMQGITGMTPVKTDGSGVTQPISGTVDTELPAAAAITADAQSAPTAPSVYAYLLCFDGSTNWNRCTGTPHATDSGTIAFGGTQISLNLPLTQVSDGTQWIRLRNFVALDNAAATPGMGLAMAGSVRRDTAASSASTAGNNATLNTDASGLLWGRTADPCSAHLPTTVPISQTGSSKLIAGVAGKTTVLCGGLIIAAASEVLDVVQGTQTTTPCDTATVALVGSTTTANGLAFAANGGWILSGTLPGLTAGADLCLMQSGSSRLAGYVTYVTN